MYTKKWDNYTKDKYPSRKYLGYNKHPYNANFALSNPGQGPSAYIVMLDHAWNEFVKYTPKINFEIKHIFSFYLEDTRQPDGRRKVKTGIVASRIMRNVFQCDEITSYYFVAKKYASRKWSGIDFADITKFEGQEAAAIDKSIVDNFLSVGNTNHATTMVVAMALRESTNGAVYEMKFRFRYLSYDECKKYMAKYGEKVTYQPPDNLPLKVTIPTSIMSDDDPLEKILVPV